MRKIRFGTLRNHLSVVDRISICNEKTLYYENYVSIKEVPKSYNKWIVYGVGMIDSEVLTEKGIKLFPHLEVVLCPKKHLFRKKG